MKTVVLFLVHGLTLLVRLLRPGGVRSVMAENLLLKQQLIVLGRAHSKAPRLRPSDRLLLGWLSLSIPLDRLSRVAVILRPATLLRFHRALVNRKYRCLFGSNRNGKPGPKGPSPEVVKIIVELKQRHPRYGCPRIAQIVTNTFGIEINKDTVRRVLVKHVQPDPGQGAGPSWLTFIGNTKDSLWSIDLFRCESLTLTSHWVLVVMDQWSRKIIGFGVHRGPVDGPGLCRMLSQAMSGSGAPVYLSSDNDPLFRYHRWKANLRIQGIKEIKTVPYVPMSHPFVERLIGTMRREYLDHVPFWNSLDLEKKLDCFKDYYNSHRVHASLKGQPPSVFVGEQPRIKVRLDHYGWKSHCGGLFQTPVAV